MKSVIIYYSYNGNTRQVAEVLSGLLSTKGQVDRLDLVSLDEPSSFLYQCRRAFSHVRSKIEEVNFDLSGYDLICLGTPVWAFAPAPAINTYLDKCSGIEGKEIILFATCGSGAGKERCLDYMQGLLAQKGALVFKRLTIQQRKVRNREFVGSQINKVLRLWPNG